MSDENSEEEMFAVEETAPAPVPRPLPKPKLVHAAPEVTTIEENEETNEDDDSSYVEIVEPFTTKGGYVFSLTAIQDDDGDRFVSVQMDNVTIELPLQDVIEMIAGYSQAIPLLIAEAQKPKA